MQHSGEIVKTALRAKGMTQVELARRIGRDQTLISRYLSSQIEISDKAARDVAQVLEMDFEELHHQLQRDRLDRKMARLGTQFKEVIGTEEGTGDEVNTVGGVSLEAPAIAVVPMLDYIPINKRGWSIEEEANYALPPDIHVDLGNSFAAKVSGENMADGVVDKGDTIVVDCSAEIKDGEIALVVVNSKPLIRKIHRSGGTVVLQSSGNREESVIFLSQEDDFEIIGRLAVCTKLF